MFEKKLIELIEKAKNLREYYNNNDSASYYYDNYEELSEFLLKSLINPIFKNKNAKIIANHFDEILPFIVSSNINILLLHAKLLIEQPNFTKKFNDGLRKYPYTGEIQQLFYYIYSCLHNNPNIFNDFINDEILKTIAEKEIDGHSYIHILSYLNEENQRKILEMMVENKRDIPYLGIEFKGNNKDIIYNNLQLFIENAQNLYNLMEFVKDDQLAMSEVKYYMDTHQDKAINSIFCETDKLEKMKDPSLKKIIELIILDVMKNEKVNFSDITYKSGGFSRVLLIGEKVIKIGSRMTKYFPNNPYIIAPLLRKEFEFNGEFCFVEVTERVDTSEKPSKEELYQLFKNLRNLGLIWTDIKEINVGRLKKENIIHWRENINPSEEILTLHGKRGDVVLKEGDWVILDADFIYDENDPNINYINQEDTSVEFEKRYQEEMQIELEKQIKIIDINTNKIDALDIIKEDNIRKQ